MTAFGISCADQTTCALDVQSLEPLSSTLAEQLLAGEWAHPITAACLGPVLLGVLLVTRDASLSWGGLAFAAASSAGLGEV